MELTQDQIDAYLADGYLKIPDVFTPAEMSILRADCNSIASSDRERPDGNISELNSESMRVCFGIDLDSKAVAAAVRVPRILGPVRQMLGEQIYLFQTRINAKMGRLGEGYPWHTDFANWINDGVQRGSINDMITVSILLRVRPETLCRITEFSEHESNGRELDEGERVAVEVLPVLGQSAAAVEPGDGAFDHPTPGLDDEALHPIGSLDDLGLEIGQDAGQGAVKDRPLIGAVGEQFPEKGKQTEQGRQQRETAVAILNVGGGDDAVQQQALRIDQNMPLLALDQLAGIEAVAVDASPPFSALFTL